MNRSKAQSRSIAVQFANRFAVLALLGLFLAQPVSAVPLSWEPNPFKTNYVQTVDPSSLNVMGTGNQSGFGFSKSSATASTFTSLTGSGFGKSVTDVEGSRTPVLLPNGDVRGPTYILETDITGSTFSQNGANYMADVETETSIADRAQVGDNGVIRFDWELEGSLSFNGSVTGGPSSTDPEYEYDLQITVNGLTQVAQANSFKLQNIGGNLGISASGALVFDTFAVGDIVDFKIELITSNTAGERYGNNSSLAHELDAQIVWNTGNIDCVPEPGTMTLLGVAGLAALRRRKKAEA